MQEHVPARTLCAYKNIMPLQENYVLVPLAGLSNRLELYKTCIDDLMIGLVSV